MELVLNMTPSASFVPCTLQRSLAHWPQGDMEMTLTMKFSIIQFTD